LNSSIRFVTIIINGWFNVKFKKELGLLEAVTISVGNMIGVGILIIPAVAAEVAGPLSLLAWLLTGLISIICGYSFAELARGFGKTGGPYVYAGEALGETAGFVAAWTSLLGYLPSVAVMLKTFTYYLMSAFLFGDEIAIFCSILIVVGLTAMNIRGVKLSSRFQDIIVFSICALLTVLIVIALPRIDPSNLQPFTPYGWGSLGLAMVYTIWPYFGWETVTVPAGEFKKPRRDIPLGLILGTSIVALLYLLTSFVAMGTVSWMRLAESRSPLSDLAYVLLGPYGKIIMSVGALTIIISNLNVNILSLSRLMYSVARDGVFPRELGRLHKSYGTPHLSILAISSILILLLLSGLFEKLILFSTVPYLIMYALSFLSSIVLRRRRVLARSSLKDSLAFAAALLCVFLITQNRLEQIIYGFITTMIGVAVFLIGKRRRKIILNA